MQREFIKLENDSGATLFSSKSTSLFAFLFPLFTFLLVVVYKDVRRVLVYLLQEGVTYCNDGQQQWHAQTF